MDVRILGDKGIVIFFLTDADGSDAREILKNLGDFLNMKTNGETR
jgi:hypothetical protein